MQNLTTERDKNLSQNTQVEDAIFKHLLIGVGTIAKIYNKGRRADVTLPYLDVNLKPTIIKGVELLRTGTRKVSIFVEPSIGDNVLLFATQHYVASLIFGAIPKADLPSTRNYSTATIKGLVVQPNTENETTADAYIHVANDGKITLNAPADIDLTIQGNANVTVEKDLTAEVKGKVTATVTGDATIESKSKCTVNSPNTKLTGGIVEIGGTVAPTGSGALCGIPACIFSGAPHVGNQSAGT